MTKIIILSAVGLLIAYDAFAYFKWGVDATISRVLLRWSKFDVWIVLATGILIGHLFLDQKPDEPNQKK